MEFNNTERRGSETIRLNFLELKTEQKDQVNLDFKLANALNWIFLRSQGIDILQNVLDRCAFDIAVR